jgi:hypothetical protein
MAFFFFFGSTGVWTQGPVLVWQVLITWATPPALLCFSGRVFALVVFPETKLRLKFPIFDFPNSWISRACHHACLIGWDRVSLTFYSDWSQIMTLLIFASTNGHYYNNLVAYVKWIYLKEVKDIFFHLMAKLIFKIAKGKFFLCTTPKTQFIGKKYID